MDQDQRDTPIGSGHLAAMARLGLKELRQAAFFDSSNIAQPGEPGLIGNPTQGEVAESRRTDSVNEELQLEQDREAPEQELDD